MLRTQTDERIFEMDSYCGGLCGCYHPRGYLVYRSHTKPCHSIDAVYLNTYVQLKSLTNGDIIYEILIN